MSRTTECYEKVSRLMDIVDDLTEWENEFINDMAEVEQAGGLFTEGQMDKIEEIHFAHQSRLA